MSEATATTVERIDWKEVSDKLQNLLRLRTLPVGRDFAILLVTT